MLPMFHDDDAVGSLYKCYPDAEDVHMKRLKEAAALL
jgi:hypothetical protein